jgi:hypothetical protein
MRRLLIFLHDLTAPRFLNPCGMDIAGTFPITWDKDAKWEKPSRVHLYFKSKLEAKP